jgi:hypothetical protein
VRNRHLRDITERLEASLRTEAIFIALQTGLMTLTEHYLEACNRLVLRYIGVDPGCAWSILECAHSWAFLTRPTLIWRFTLLLGKRRNHPTLSGQQMEVKPKYDVASVLERESQTTIANWLALVEGEPDLISVPLSRKDRCAHLPALFRDLVARLRSPRPLGTHAVESSAASLHGRLRCNQGYTPTMIVGESRMLQVCIFQTLQRNVEDTEPGVLLLHVMVIADEVDSQLAQAMTAYSSEPTRGPYPM